MRMRMHTEDRASSECGPSEVREGGGAHQREEALIEEVAKAKLREEELLAKLAQPR